MLEVKPTAWGYEYRIDGAAANRSALQTHLEQHPEAHKLFTSGKTQASVGTVLAGVGGFAFGFDSGTRMGGGKGNTALLVGGCGAGVLGIVLALSGEKKMKRAVELYNNDRQAWDIRLEPKESGVALAFRF